MCEAYDPYWPPSQSIDVDDEDAVYKWAIEASLEDARRRGTVAASLVTSARSAIQSFDEERRGSSSSCFPASQEGNTKATDSSASYARWVPSAKRGRLDDLNLDRQRLLTR